MEFCSESIFSRLPETTLIKKDGNCRIYGTGSIKNSRRIHASGQRHLACLFLCHSFLEEKLFCQQRQEQNFDSFEYIVSGKFFFRSGSQMICAGAGDLVFLPEGKCNTLLYRPESGPCEKFGMIPGGSMYSTLRKLFGLDSFRCLSFGKQDTVRSLLARLWEKMIHLDGTVTPEETGGLLFEFLQIAAGDAAGGGELPLLQQIRHFVEENLENDIKVSCLAAKFALTQPQLLSLFRKNMDLTPGQYLIRRRMARAAVLLGDSSLRINEIAFASGYKDPLYFSTEFRRFYGVSPKQYRNSLLQKFTN